VNTLPADLTPRNTKERGLLRICSPWCRFLPYALLSGFLCDGWKLMNEEGVEHALPVFLG
jgi:hypothetical protein